MKRRKTCYVVLCTLAVGLLLGGCGLAVDVARELLQQEEVLPEEKYVYFLEEDRDPKQSEAVDGEGLADYEASFAELNSYTYFRALTEEERLIYRILERALDEGTPYVLADERLFEECDRTVMEILTFFSLDSPMVEQNISVLWQKRVRISTLDGYFYRIEIPRFGEEFLEKKQAALLKARGVALGAPVSGSEADVALYFYQYLTDNVTYRDYEGEESETAHFLYDVFFNGYSHCDGFTNGFSLLCALRELSAVEKQYQPAEDSGQVGHAWNAVRLDGVWYNVDCALEEETARAEEEYGILFRFGFSDELQSYPCQHGELLPRCERNYVPLSFRLPSADDPAFYGEVLEAFEETELHYILFSLEEDDLEREHLQEIVNRRRYSLRLITAKWNGKQYYFMIEER